MWIQLPSRLWRLQPSQQRMLTQHLQVGLDGASKSKQSTSHQGAYIYQMSSNTVRHHGEDYTFLFFMPHNLHSPDPHLVTEQIPWMLQCAHVGTADGLAGYAAQPAAYAPAPGYATYAPPYSNPDEVRTVFVTGFPPDVKERELNNLLRFVHGCAPRMHTQPRMLLCC